MRVGLAGWSYRDWQGIVYPAPAGRGFDRLDWIARFTDLVEINATFYRAARPRDAERWARTVERYPDFRFTAKLEKIFTHDAEGAGDAAERRYRDGLAPLVESGRLAAVLIQFPYSFHNIAANRRRLARLLNRFSDYPLTVEFRHRGWLTADLLAFLASRQVTLAGVDQPAVGQSVPPSLPLTGPFFYIRLHGRHRLRVLHAMAHRAGCSLWRSRARGARSRGNRNRDVGWSRYGIGSIRLGSHGDCISKVSQYEVDRSLTNRCTGRYWPLAARQI